MITLWYLGFIDGYAGYVRRAHAELENGPATGVNSAHSYKAGEWDGLWQRFDERQAAEAV